MAEFDLSNMFFQMKIKTQDPEDFHKLSYLCIQTDEGSLVYTRAPQGLPGVSEYEEELTDTVFGDMVSEGRMAKWADNIYVGGEDEKSFLENIKEVCSRMKTCHLRAAPRKMIIAIKETTIMG